MKNTRQQTICDHFKMEGFMTIITHKEMCYFKNIVTVYRRVLVQKFR